MKARIPKAWQDLPEAQRKLIVEHAQRVAMEQAEEQMNKDARLILDLYMKMVCVTLHDAFGFGEKRLSIFLGNHKRLFYRQRRLVRENAQIDYLNKRMAEIFRKEGFPQEFFDNMLGAVEAPEDKNGGTENEEIFQETV